MSRHRGGSSLVWDTQTIFWARGPSAHVGQGDLWMMAEDLALEIFGHFNRRGSNKPASTCIQNCSPELASILLKAVAAPFGGQGAGEVCDFVMRVARQLVMTGHTDYELCFGRWKGRDESRPAAVRLAYVPHGSLVRIGRRWFQVVPEHVQKEGPRVRLVESDRLVHFQPPSSLRNSMARARVLLPLVKRLESNWMHRFTMGGATEAFRDVKRSCDIALARATRDLGWNARGLFQEQTADFHWIVRELRWKRCCVLIRDEIIITLTKVLAKAGRTFGERPLLRLEDLPTVGDVDDAEKQLRAGPTRFDVLLGKFA